VERPYIFIGLNVKVTEVILNQNFYRLSSKNNSSCIGEISILETSLNLYYICHQIPNSLIVSLK